MAEVGSEPLGLAEELAVRTDARRRYAASGSGSVAARTSPARSVRSPVRSPARSTAGGTSLWDDCGDRTRAARQAELEHLRRQLDACTAAASRERQLIASTAAQQSQVQSVQLRVAEESGVAARRRQEADLERLRQICGERSRLHAEQLAHMERQAELLEGASSTAAALPAPSAEGSAERFRQAAAASAESLRRCAEEQRMAVHEVRRSAAAAVTAETRRREAAVHQATVAVDEQRSQHQRQLRDIEEVAGKAAAMYQGRLEQLAERTAERQADLHRDQVTALGAVGMRVEEQTSRIRSELQQVQAAEAARTETFAARIQEFREHSVDRQELQEEEVRRLQNAQRDLCLNQERELLRLRAEQELQRERQEDSLRRLRAEREAAEANQLRLHSLHEQEVELQRRIASQGESMKAATASYERRVAAQQEGIDRLRAEIRQREEAARALEHDVRLRDVALRERDAVTLPGLRDELRRKEAEMAAAARRHDEQMAALRGSAAALSEDLARSKDETRRLEAELSVLSRSAAEAESRMTVLREELLREEAAAETAAAVVAEQLKPEIDRLRQETQDAQAQQELLRRRVEHQEADVAGRLGRRAGMVGTLEKENDDLRAALKYLMSELQAVQGREKRARSRERAQRQSITRLKDGVRDAQRERARNEEAITVVTARNRELEGLVHDHRPDSNPLIPASVVEGALRPVIAAPPAVAAPPPPPPPPPVAAFVDPPLRPPPLPPAGLWRGSLT